MPKSYSEQEAQHGSSSSGLSWPLDLTILVIGTECCQCRQHSYCIFGARRNTQCQGLANRLGSHNVTGGTG